MGIMFVAQFWNSLWGICNPQLVYFSMSVIRGSYETIQQFIRKSGIVSKCLSILQSFWSRSMAIFPLVRRCAFPVEPSSSLYLDTLCLYCYDEANILCILSSALKFLVLCEEFAILLRMWSSMLFSLSCVLPIWMILLETIADLC